MRSPLMVLALLALPLLGACADQSGETTARPFQSAGVVDTPEYESVEIEEIVPTTTTTSVFPPSLAIACPQNEYRRGGSLQAPFDHDVANTAPLARWSIDYGDGKSYETAHRAGAEAAVFEHVYQTPGSYSVSATVTDKNGLSDTDHCSFSWSPITLDYDRPDFDSSTSSDLDELLEDDDYPTPSYTPPTFDYSPPGGYYNDAGCPRDQWVNGYTRRDGTYVNGYYRNSGSDGCGGG